MIIFALDGKSSRVFTAPPTTSDDVSEPRRAVPFHRGIFQPLPLATPFQGARGRGRGENKNWESANVLFNVSVSLLTAAHCF